MQTGEEEYHQRSQHHCGDEVEQLLGINGDAEEDVAVLLDPFHHHCRQKATGKANQAADSCLDAKDVAAILACHVVKAKIHSARIDAAHGEGVAEIEDDVQIRHGGIAEGVDQKSDNESRYYYISYYKFFKRFIHFITSYVYILSYATPKINFFFISIDFYREKW